MKRKAVVYAILSAFFLASIWGTTTFAHADQPGERGGTAPIPGRVPARLSAAGQASRETSAPAAYTWAVAKSPVGYALTSVDMVSATDGWAVGYWDRYGNGSPRGETILRWDGIWWDEWYSWSEDPPLFSVAVSSSDKGWAVGENGRISRWDGINWNSVNWHYGQRLKSVAMVSDTDGWAVGSSGSCDSSGLDGTILRWDGNNWSTWTESISDRVLNSVDMVSANDGWAVGYYCHYGIPSTYNSVIMHWNGSSWNAVSSPVGNILNAVKMVTATDGWAVGEQGVILHWDGSVWSKVTSPASCELNSISMVSANDGWVAGGGGYPCSSSEPSLILHWDGNAWSKVDSPVSEALNSISMISSEEGWAVGEAGTILHYTSLDKLVRVAGAATSDYDWNWKSEFNAGAPIRYLILIVNESGSDAKIELTYAAKGPNDEPIFNDQFSDTIPPGVWQWGDDWTVPESAGGTYTFTGSGLYMGTTTQSTVAFTVTGPTNYKVHLPLTMR